jgi:hypothetical protein
MKRFSVNILFSDEFQKSLGKYGSLKKSIKSLFLTNGNFLDL